MLGGRKQNKLLFRVCCLEGTGKVTGSSVMPLSSSSRWDIVAFSLEQLANMTAILRPCPKVLVFHKAGRKLASGIILCFQNTLNDMTAILVLREYRVGQEHVDNCLAVWVTVDPQNRFGHRGAIWASEEMQTAIQHLIYNRQQLRSPLAVLQHAAQHPAAKWMQRKSCRVGSYLLDDELTEHMPWGQLLEDGLQNPICIAVFHQLRNMPWQFIEQVSKSCFISELESVLHVTGKTCVKALGQD